jgi:uncharacterized protein affecting Mg2+/Co2+ transport
MIDDPTHEPPASYELRQRARNSADDEGRYAIGFKVTVKDGVPARLKVISRISTTITDEIESTVDDPNQPTLL